jgi:hypothetical protein
VKYFDSILNGNGNNNEEGDHNNSSASSTPREERDEPDFPINAKAYFPPLSITPLSSSLTLKLQDVHKTPPNLETISMPATPNTHNAKPLTLSRYVSRNESWKGGMKGRTNS